MAVAKECLRIAFQTGTSLESIDIERARNRPSASEPPTCGRSPFKGSNVP
jgi:hypothetical protein